MEVSSTVSCLLLILRTLDGPIHGGTNPQFPYLTVELFTITDLVFTALFTFDFLLRMLCCPAFWSEKVISDDARSSLTCITGRKFEPFIKCPFNWFDFASILPSYISELFGKSSVIALLRLCRMLRILKITRNFSGTYVLLKAIRESIPPIKIAILFLAINTLIFGTLMYFLDPCYDKTTCSFTDAFNGAYFVLVTMTTVGYGDLVPSKDNSLARFATVAIMTLGSLFLAMPIYIVGGAFNHAWQSHLAESNTRLSLSRQSMGIPGLVGRKRILMKDLDKDILQYDGEHNGSVIRGDKTGRFVLTSQKLLQDPQFDNVTIKCSKKFDQLSRSYLKMTKAATDASIRTDRLLKNLEEAKDWDEQEIRTECRAINASMYTFHENIRRVDTIGSKLLKEDDMFLLQKVVVLQKAAKKWRSKGAPVAGKRFKREGVLNAKIIRYIKQQNLKCTLQDVTKAMESNTLRDKLWLFLEVPVLTKLGRIIRSVLFWSIFGSIMVTIGETMPDFQPYGEGTYFCERVVEEYCLHDHISVLNDPACFVHPSIELSSPMLLRFDCFLQFQQEENARPVPTCYGVGLNFGSGHPDAYSCESSIQPFRNASQLEDTHLHDICLRLQCDDGNATYIDMTLNWVFLEWLFAIIFTLEQAASFYVRPGIWFIKDPIVWIDIISVFPFYYMEVSRIAAGTPPIYSISPGATNFGAILRMLRMLRIIKVYQNMSESHVLYQALTKAWQKLRVTYFFLAILTIILSFMVYEAEMGTLCFVGSECMVDDKLVELSAGLQENKRILVNSKGDPSQFEDLLSCIWFTVAAMTSVGYGDVVPLTQAGKCIAVVAMLIGACYTAMPLTMMGGQFNSCYTAQQKRLKLFDTLERANTLMILNRQHSESWLEIRRFVWGSSWVLGEDFQQLVVAATSMENIEAHEKRLQVIRFLKEYSRKLRSTKMNSLRLAAVVQKSKREGVDIANEQRRVVDTYAK